MSNAASDARRAIIARRHNFHNSYKIAREARRANLAYDLAFALITQESGDGSNIFGHDPTIFSGAGRVTKAQYLKYKRARGVHGEGGMQGVGPTQLTYYSFQDAADRIGGAWRPRNTIRVGFQDLVHLIRVYRGDVRHALAVYNGGASNPNFAYADSVLAHRRTWHARFNPSKKRK